MTQQFLSDNNAGMCPQAIEALVAANREGHAQGYGNDRWTAEACDRIRALLEKPDAAVFFVFNGTASNALALAQITPSWGAVIAHAISHVDTDEAGAPEFFSGGAKIMTAESPDARLTAADVRRLATRYTGLHHVKASALSLTQATELGTLYRPEEIRALTAEARRHGLRVHMDGARFANALVALGGTAADITWRAGVDVLSLGGVKNGLGVGEAVVFLDPALATDFEWRVKQAGHLNSKMRLATAPWCAVLRDGSWLRHAAHANAMARRLAAAITPLAGVRLIAPVEANGVFAEIPVAAQAAMRAKGWGFYTFYGETGCRLMCAWDTEPATVDRFAADLAAVIWSPRPAA